MGWSTASSDEIDVALDQFGGLVSAATARVCELIVEVDVRQSWMSDGSRSLADWVAARLGVRHETASRLVRVARRLVDLPFLLSQLACGGITFDQAEAISRIADSASEAAWVERVRGLSAAQLDRLIRRHRPIPEADANSVWERRRLVRQWNLDESELKFHGRLPGDAGRMFDSAVDTRVDRMSPNPETGLFDPLPNRAADALIEMAATDGNTPGSPARVTIFADLDTLTTDGDGTAQLDNTTRLANTTTQRLACDAIVENVIRDNGRVVGVGRSRRSIPPWLRRLVFHRDGGCCQFPGCNNTRWLQVHHVIPWARGGPTDLDNLILLCGHHHRFVHERGWHITGHPSTRQFRRPDWTLFPQPRAPLDARLVELICT